MNLFEYRTILIFIGVICKLEKEDFSNERSHIMNAVISKIMLILVLSALIFAGIGCCAQKEKPMSMNVKNWENTPAGVYVPRY